MIKKFTLLLLAMLCIANVNADVYNIPMHLNGFELPYSEFESLDDATNITFKLNITSSITGTGWEIGRINHGDDYISFTGTKAGGADVTEDFVFTAKQLKDLAKSSNLTINLWHECSINSIYASTNKLTLYGGKLLKSKLSALPNDAIVNFNITSAADKGTGNGLGDIKAYDGSGAALSSFSCYNGESSENPQYYKVSSLMTYIGETEGLSISIYNHSSYDITVSNGNQLNLFSGNFAVDYSSNYKVVNGHAWDFAEAGDVISIGYTGSGDNWQIKIMKNWTILDNTTDPVSLTDASGTYYVSLSAADITTLQSFSMEIQGQNISITSVDLIRDKRLVEISSAGEATYSASKILDFSESTVSAYYASAYDKEASTVTMTSIETVPAGEGLYVRGTAGQYLIPIGSSASAITNYLHGTGESSYNVPASATGAYRYIFAKDNTTSEIGFYKLEADHTLAAHKAYLQTSEDCTPPAPKGLTRGLIRLSFGGGEGTTAINTALKNPIVEDGLYYTLQGVAVKNPSKGIYILNGKKVFVK